MPKKKKGKRVVPLTVGDSKVVPLTVNDSKVVPLTVGDSNVVPLTVGDDKVVPLTFGDDDLDGEVEIHEDGSTLPYRHPFHRPKTEW